MKVKELIEDNEEDLLFLLDEIFDGLNYQYCKSLYFTTTENNRRVLRVVLKWRDVKFKVEITKHQLEHLDREQIGQFVLHWVETFNAGVSAASNQSSPYSKS